MKRVLYLIIFLIFLYYSCGYRDKLSFNRESFTNKNLRIDGIYYSKPNFAHFFLYENGVLYDGGVRFNGSFNDLIEYYNNSDNYKNAYILPYNWGIYKVDNNKIIIEKWLSSDEFGGYSRVNFHGDIINDTTLIINHPAKMIGRDTFYFHKFYSKPDSINKFIK